MNVLITGSNGQLGSEIRDLQGHYDSINIILKDLPELDICDFEKVSNFITNNNIKSVINCAAYTAVDRAEEDSETAKKVNFTGVLNLVNALKSVGGKLIHISTDYVFDGNNSIPYEEDHVVNPIGVYGKTKREGELAVINSDLDGIVIRTSWLYSPYGNNFVKTMMRLGKEKEELEVIFDQVGTPTYGGDLATACLEILTQQKNRIDENGKIYHFSNEGVASWYDLAIAVMEINNIDCRVYPIETKEYETFAERPHYSVLNKSKIKNDFSVTIPYWRDSLAKCIAKINKA